MTIEQYYMMLGAAGVAGAIMGFYLLLVSVRMLYQGMKTLEGIEDYDL